VCGSAAMPDSLAERRRAGAPSEREPVSQKMCTGPSVAELAGVHGMRSAIRASLSARGAQAAEGAFAVAARFTASR
jgi:hypothetical protein